MMSNSVSNELQSPESKNKSYAGLKRTLQAINTIN